MNSEIKRGIACELHKAARKNFKRRKTIIKGYADLWQADLADFQNFKKINQGNRYILMVIDCYSKFLWVEPIKSKTAEAVSFAMKRILNRANYFPKFLQTDAGTEFYNKRFAKIMKDYGINHYSTYSTKKAAIIERCIRTIKSWLYKEFSARGKNKWIDIIDSVVGRYNSKPHRTTGLRPEDITQNTKLRCYDTPKIVFKSKFKVGDIVRISKYKAAFDKSYTQNYTNELFKIKKIKCTEPITYLIEDMEGQAIKGCFYAMELQKTSFPNIYLVEKVLKKKGDKLFVKWMGFSDQYSTWLHQRDVL